MAIGDFIHPLLGIVHVRIRANSHRISARWRNGEVYLNVPRHVSERTVMDAFAIIAPRLAKSRPSKHYHDGQQLDFDGLSVIIRRQDRFPNKVIARAQCPVSTVEVGCSLDFDSADTTRAISKMICHIARKVAYGILLPQACQRAQQVGKHPVGWTISTGHKVLGHCSSKGTIALSYMNLFLPRHLRDYVVNHELAHLSEMSHSRRFHELCDHYCEGREQQFIKELRLFDWPVLR